MVGLGMGRSAGATRRFSRPQFKHDSGERRHSARWGVRRVRGAASTLVLEDAAAITQVPGVQHVAAQSITRANHRRQSELEHEVQGTDVDCPDPLWPTVNGAFFTPQDVTTSAKVAVLGGTVRDQLFGPDVDPTGQVIRIGNQPFTVAGVRAIKGQTGVGQDQDDVVFVPYTTVMKKLRGVTFVQQITVSATRRRQRHRPLTRSPPCCACGTRSSRAIPTISWSARWMKSPACEKRRRRL